MKRLYCSILFIISMCVLCACNDHAGENPSIIGEWIVESYFLEDEAVPVDHVRQEYSLYGGEYSGIRAEGYNGASIVFFNDGTAIVRWPVFSDGYYLESYTDHFMKYAIAGTFIKISEDESDQPMILSRKDDRIILEDILMEFDIVFVKKN